MNELTPLPDPSQPERIQEEIVIEVGQWYWIKDRKNGEWNPNAKRKHKDDYEWIGCVTHIGSNFVKVKHPNGASDRIHLDLFHKRTRLEPNPKGVIGGQIQEYKGVVEKKMAEVKAITARLGVSPRVGIEQKGATSARGLITLSQTPDVKKYKKSLVKAKEKELPKLFKEIEEANKELAMWMSAEAIPLKAVAKGLTKCVEEVEDRIFNVSLYAGLTEDVTQISDGESASFDEKLHLMQRRLYMDEECLVDYKHGGMEFSNIREFDEWLAMPEHRDRILPFPRCMVAFRVRRDKKERESDGSIASFFVNFKLEKLDELTFLFIRNGEKLFRMNCDLEFGNMIFPSAGEFDPNEPMMIKMFAGSIDEIVPRREYEDLYQEDLKRREKYEQWAKDNPEKSWIHNPHHHTWFSHNRWHPFDKTSVYFDEAAKHIEDQIKQYNRIVLIIQGLFDRSPILHPHPPVRTWTADGFAAAIKLVYDGSHTIHHGDPPDFEAYRAKCNARFKDGDVAVGQQECWERREAEKENARRDNDWRWSRSNHDYHVKRWSPPGNPGPGYLTRIVKVYQRTQEALFKWTRERRNYSWRGGERGDPMPASARIPFDVIFNISAYKLGDFKQFFQDPRTRAEYLKWAPILLTAEEVHAGNLSVEDGMAEESLAKQIRKKAQRERAKARRAAKKAKKSKRRKKA